MYCSECKLRVADDNVTICPVCEGPLQPDAENEEVVVDAADKDDSTAPEIRVEEKFDAYEKPDQGLDFKPEELGLQSSDQEGLDKDDEDIRVLAELWEEEDIDADLEGILAEAFSLDEANDDIEAEDDLDLSPLEVSPVQPPAAVPESNRRPLLLLLILIVIGVGSASLFYMQKPGPKTDSIVKPLPLLKEPVAAEKVVTAEPTTVVVENVADDKTGKIAAIADPARDSALVEVANLKAQEAEALPKEESANLKTEVDSQVSAEKQEALAGDSAEVLDKTVTSEEMKTVPSPVPALEPVKKSETLVASLGRAEEKASLPGEALPEEDVKIVDETKSLVPSSDSSPHEEVGKTSARVDEEAVVDKTEVASELLYRIHIGSFKSHKRAANQLAMLQEKGFAAYQVEVDLEGKGIWQRVMIPGGTTRDEAKAVQKKLAELFPREDSLILKSKK